jgi:SEC-C motif
VVAGAYQRSHRLLDYLNSAAEVPIFRRNGGRTVEFGRIRLSDYRIVLPIGLTVEPLAPFSTLCTVLPSMQPILGRHAFMAMSVDDLLLLRRVLATPEEFIDYMGFRQQAAGDKSAPRYFEADHLADYAAMVANEIATEPAAEAPDESQGETATPEVSAPVAQQIAQGAQAEAIEAAAPPEPERPREVANLLVALEAAHEAGWQRARDALRSRDAGACDALATALREAAETLTTQECRWLHDHGEPPLFIWLQRFGTRADLAALKLKAKKVAIGAGERSITAILAHARSPGEYSRAVSVGIVLPPQDSTEYRRYRAEAAEAKAREDLAQVRHVPPPGSAAPARKIGRNEPCWCDSGKKFKRCHGGH